MPSFTYTAKREIKSGHTLGDDYTITTEFMVADGEMPEFVGHKHKSLSGENEVNVLHRLEKYLAVTVDYVHVDGSGTPDTDDYIEFFNSIAAGEAFTYNDGTSDHAVKIDGKPTRARNGVYFSYSFRFRFI